MLSVKYKEIGIKMFDETFSGNFGLCDVADIIDDDKLLKFITEWLTEKYTLQEFVATEFCVRRSYLRGLKVEEVLEFIAGLYDSSTEEVKKVCDSATSQISSFDRYWDLNTIHAFD